MTLGDLPDCEAFHFANDPDKALCHKLPDGYWVSDTGRTYRLGSHAYPVMPAEMCIRVGGDRQSDWPPPHTRGEVD